MLEAFVESTTLNPAALNVPALEQRQVIASTATPATVPSAVPAAETAQRTVGQQLLKRSLLTAQAVVDQTSGTTVQQFLQAQPASNTRLTQNAPSLFSPRETRTEVVEEQIGEGTQFDVTTIVIVGNTRFTTDELAVYTKPLEGKKISLSELREAVDSITKLYVSKGYISSRAFLGNQEVTDGRVTIQILEGSIESIKVVGNNRLPERYILDRLQAGIETPLRADKLEEQLRLLQLDPALSSVEASLSPGTETGKSILTINVKEAKSAYFGLTSDNYSAPVVGSERYGVYGGLRNSLIPGDEFFTSYNRTTSGGSNALDFSYKAPVSANNATVQLRVAPSWYKITDKEIGSIFDIDGNSALYELTYRQPIVRNFRKEVGLSLGFAVQDGETNISNLPLFNTENRARVLKFGQDFISRDNQGAWAGQSSFNLGLDVFNATKNAGDLADGQFFSWTGQLQRVQRFNPSNLLIASLSAQLSPDALLPSQQFTIGGGQSVRGYRQNARFGDSGLRFSLEHRTVIARNKAGGTVAQLAPFFDLGTVWNTGDNPTPSPNQRFLTGVGLGLILQPAPGLNMRFDYGAPLRKVSEKNDNLQDQAFYFSLGFQPQ